MRKEKNNESAVKHLFNNLHYLKFYIEHAQTQIMILNYLY